MSATNSSLPAALPSTGVNGASALKTKAALKKRTQVVDDIYSPANVITKGQWTRCIGLISEGISVAQAVIQTKIPKAILEGELKTNVTKRSQWEEAKTASLWRHWDINTVEDIMVEIAMGSTVKSALINNSFEGEVFANVQVAFYRLLLRDQTVKEMYEEARQIQAEKMAIDDIIEISDDKIEDLTVDGRPNSAAVNRDRLRVSSRQWIAAKMHHKRFGDRIQQDVNQHIIVDHATRLEEARKRSEKANKLARKQSQMERAGVNLKKKGVIIDGEVLGE